MATGNQNAKQRAFFGRKNRIEKAARAEGERQADEALKAEQAKKAATARAEQSRRDMARRAELQREKDRQAAERRKAAATKREFNRDVDAKKAEAAKQEKARAEIERKTAARDERTRRQIEQRKAAQTKQEFNRQADDKKAAEAKEQQRQQQARDRRNERLAVREVRKAQANARASMTFRQRQETNELRSQHKTERKGIAAEIAQHDADYLNRIERIDQKERQALAAFDDRRGTIRGRIEEMRKGKATIDEQRRALQDGFDRERNETGRKLEAVKDRAMQREFARPIEQALERKQMMERHAGERDQQAQRHQQVFPGAVADYKQTIERAQTQAQEQWQEMKAERSAGISR